LLDSHPATCETTAPDMLARVLAFVTVAMLAVACGSSSSSTASNSPKASPTPSPTKAQQIASVDACSLVSASEASTAIGTTVQGFGGVVIPGACVYVSQDGKSAVFIYAQVYSDTTSADAITPDQLAAIMQGQYGISQAKVVEGIGDKAVEYTTTAASSGSSGIAIFVFKANVVLFIILSPSTNSAAVEALAKTAVGRLH
ncbi:MAG TPA: hypothetical protein VHQ03_11020, partial [Candidatus Dormibacteraeota bacterium]|nr:hypothetical protein [Candidatus Dormibacteraeota bacterium]